jgi:AbrB family looped-hinge helix DNA binding protein
MAPARSKLTGQGQISVPAEVRKRLGIGPGSALACAEDGERVFVPRAGTSTTEDVHRAAFPDGAPARRPLTALKQGPRRHARERHARR